MKKWVLMCAALGVPLAAVANPYGAGQGGMQGGMGQGMGGGMRPPGPPPEFYSACKGKREGDTVTVNGPHGQMQGACRLLFVPAQPPGQQGQGRSGTSGGAGGQGRAGQGAMGQSPRQ